MGRATTSSITMTKRSSPQSEAGAGDTARGRRLLAQRGVLGASVCPRANAARVEMLKGRSGESYDHSVGPDLCYPADDDELAVQQVSLSAGARDFLRPPSTEFSVSRRVPRRTRVFSAGTRDENSKAECGAASHVGEEADYTPQVRLPLLPCFALPLSYLPGPILPLECPPEVPTFPPRACQNPPSWVVGPAEGPSLHPLILYIEGFN